MILPLRPPPIFVRPFPPAPDWLQAFVSSDAISVSVPSSVSGFRRRRIFLRPTPFPVEIAYFRFLPLEKSGLVLPELNLSRFLPGPDFMS
jgi:hypothetical protein